MDPVRSIYAAWERGDCSSAEWPIPRSRIRSTGRGRPSGVQVGDVARGAFHVRGAKVTKLVGYWDPARALADVGLGAPAGEAYFPLPGAEPVLDALALFVIECGLDIQVASFDPFDRLFEGFAGGLHRHVPFGPGRSACGVVVPSRRIEL